MAKNVNTPQTDVMVDTKGKLELLFEKYGKTLLIVLVVVGVGVGGYFIYKNYAENKEQERIEKSEAAATEMLGNESASEAEALVNNKEFEGTAAQNFACYVAAARYLHDGDLDTAEALIAEYKDIEDDGYLADMINAAVCGVRGDIAVERGNYEEAVEAFNSAVDMSDDQYTFVYYNEKLARIYTKMGKATEAKNCYKAIGEKYPDLADQYTKYIW